jgi:RNA polymerase sigma-70 factor (ECF subfamily)
VKNSEQYLQNTLIEDCKNGSRKAQFRIYKLYSKAMYNLAYRFVNNHEDAQDVLQETFIDCFRKIETFRYESTFGTWLKRILINHCINQIRKRDKIISYQEEIVEPVGEEEADIQINVSEIFNNIEKLPSGYRIILTLYLLEGYDHSEISEILGITESTSKSQYSRAKSRLRKMISKSEIYG